MSSFACRDSVVGSHNALPICVTISVSDEPYLLQRHFLFVSLKMPPATKQRTRLTLKEKMNLIRESESMDTVQLSKKYAVCVSGIYKILKQKDQWKFNRKAWMTASVMEEWLIDFNGRMVRQNRKICLLLDNATSHPHLDLTNIKLIFLPPNTTSSLQPLDQGIIHCFKMHYRKRILSHLINKMDSAGSKWCSEKPVCVERIRDGFRESRAIRSFNGIN